MFHKKGNLPVLIVLMAIIKRQKMNKTKFQTTKGHIVTELRLLSYSVAEMT